MSLSPIQLKDKLLKGIDEENNVVNTKVVSEVIDVLEKTLLTRNDLEVTRLGLYINTIRKKTTDQDISKRCKKLVKTWQQLVATPSSNHVSPAQGYSPANIRTPNSYTPSPNLPSQSLSPAVYGNKDKASSVPQRLISPSVRSLQTNSGGRVVSPLVRPNSNGLAFTVNNEVSLPNKRISPTSTAAKQVPAAPPEQLISSYGDTSRSSTPLCLTSRTNLNVSSRPHTPTNGTHVNTYHNSDQTNRTHAANKKRRRSEESVASDVSKKSKSLVNGVETKVSERTKTPRVKTTVQLIAELQSQNSSSLTSSDTINKIVTNQIKKEADDINISVVPASAKPRPRKKNGSLINPPDATSDMSKTKSDLVQRFLQHTVQHSLNNDHNSTDEADVDIIGLEPSESVSFNMISTVDPYSLLPELDYNSITWSDDEDNHEPIRRNPITGEYPEGYDISDGISDGVNSPARNVSRILNENWVGVNGTLGTNNLFHDWTETFNSNAESIKDDIYVLPYVIDI